MLRGGPRAIIVGALGPGKATQQVPTKETRKVRTLCVWGIDGYRRQTLERLLLKRLIHPSFRMEEPVPTANDPQVQFHWVERRNGYRRVDVLCNHAFDVCLVKKFSKRFHVKIGPHRLGRKKKPAAPLKICEGVSMMSLNINGAYAKREELVDLLEREKPDIVGLQETLCKEGGLPLRIPGYVLLESKMLPSTDGSRGLALMVRKDAGISLSEISASPHTLTGCLEWKGSDGRKHVVSVTNSYISQNRIARECALRRVIAAIGTAKRGGFEEAYILGDWNSTPVQLYTRLKNLGLTVNQLLALKNLPTTRNVVSGTSSQRCIDYILPTLGDGSVSDRQKRLRSWAGSDHYPVVLKTNSKAVSEPYRASTLCRAALCDAERKARISKISLPSGKLDDMPLGNYLEKEIAAFIEREKLWREYKEPEFYISKKMKAAIKCKKEIWVLRGREFDLELFRQAQRTIKFQQKMDARERRNRWLQKGITGLKDQNMRSLWQWIGAATKSVGRGSTSQPIRSFPKNTLLTRRDLILKEWHRHFASLCKDSNVYTPEEKAWSQSRGVYTLPGCSAPLLWSELQDALKNTANNKAPGLDKIPSEVYKAVQGDDGCESVFARSLYKVGREVIEKAVIPSLWKTALVVPVPKKGDLRDTDNYRGISLVHTMLKVFSKVVTQRVTRIAENCGLLCKEQAGFRSLEECVGQASALLEISQRRRNLGRETWVCFIDLKKAYDTVPHAFLLKKLRDMGIGGHLQAYLRELYCGQSMGVKIGTDTSDVFPYEIGVRQGCPISPILFNLYVNDIFTGMEGVKVPGLAEENVRGLLFADDTVLLAESAEELRASLKALEMWASKNRMSVNAIKCGAFRTGRDVPATGERFEIAGESIPLVEEYTYLGIPFTWDLDLDKMGASRGKQGRKAYCSMLRLLTQRQVPIEIRRRAITGALIPVLTYGGEIWGMSIVRSGPAQRVLNLALSTLLGTKRVCAVRAMEELGMEGIYSRSCRLRIRALHKWPGSRTWIGELMRKPSDIKTRRQTWMKTGLSWMKKYVSALYGTDLSPAHRKKKAKALLWKRIARVDHSKIQALAKENNWRNGYKLRDMELAHPELREGLSMMIRLRTGAIALGSRLAASGVIPRRFMRMCPVCGREGTENLTHILNQCVGYSKKRAEYNLELEELFKNYKLNPQGRSIESLVVLAGGWEDTPEPARVDILRLTARYICALMKSRIVKIRDITR